MEITLSEDQQACFNLIGEGKNLLISGEAGTGKSLLINKLRSSFEGVHITASTGLAAINVEGSTLHSWAGIYDSGLSPETMVARMPPNARYRILTCKKLIIDEISMVSDQLLDYLDTLLRLVRNTNRPLGGIQVILFGDFLQLPPVSTNGEKFCFISKAFRLGEFETRILFKNYRQLNKEFVEFLGRIRYGEHTDEDVKLLRSRDLNTMENKPVFDKHPVHLFSSNSEVDNENEKFYKQIDSKEFIYEQAEDGSENDLKQLNKNSPCKDRLKLKVGCQVMLLDNRFSYLGLVNGSVGEIIGFESLALNNDRYRGDNSSPTAKNYETAYDLMCEFNLGDEIPVVKFNNGVELAVPYHSWNKSEVVQNRQTGEEEIKIRARLVQMSLRLSWAITIHKSQGMTLDAIICDFSRIFSEGQIYVAISRVKTLEGLFIKNLNPRNIKANYQIVTYYKNLIRRLKGSVS